MDRSPPFGLRRAAVGSLLALLLIASGCLGAQPPATDAPVETYEIESPTMTPTATPPPTPATVSVLAPPRGDATLVVNGDGETLLIDTGAGSNASAVRSALEARDVSSLDLLITTGVTDGEVGGAASILQHHRPRSIGQNGLVARTDRYHAYLRAVVRANLGTQLYAMTNETAFGYGHGRISILAPPRRPLTSGRPADNVVVLSYRVHGERVLFLGDASAREQRWLQNRTQSLNATVLIVDEPTVARSGFVRDVSPSVIVVADGNAPADLDVPDGNWVVYRTAQHGPVTITIGPEGRSIAAGVSVPQGPQTPDGPQTTP